MLHYLDMFTHPQIDPYIFKIGNFGPTWYGLMYVLGFLLAIYLLKRRAKRDAWRKWNVQQAEDIVFHGGLLGVLVAMFIYAKRQGRTFFELTDYIAPVVPPGLGFGRVGNFLNGELWGKPTDGAWGFKVNEQVLHASQLYEAFLEGLVLFVILWWYSKKPRNKRSTSGLFLLFYGVFRFVVEFVRVPDSHLG